MGEMGEMGEKYKGAPWVDSSRRRVGQIRGREGGHLSIHQQTPQLRHSRSLYKRSDAVIPSSSCNIQRIIKITIMEGKKMQFLR